jgi:hypothetical protein
MGYIRTILEFIADNGIYIIIILILLVGLITKFKKIFSGNLVEWLIIKVADAEAYFGSETGQIKLRAVYDAFVKDRPIISLLVSFDSFSNLVDTALDKFENMLEEDEGVRNWFNKLQQEKNPLDDLSVEEKVTVDVIEDTYIDDKTGNIKKLNK